MKAVQGYIFFPETPEIKHESVRLEITDTKIEFEYSNDSDGLYDCNKIKIVLGVFNSIGNVTLLDCNLSGTASGSGANVKKYNADLLLKGVHIHDWNKLEFSKCIVAIPSLYNWVGVRTVENKLLTEKILYAENPKQILLTTFDKYQLFFSFGYDLRIETNEIYIRQYANLKIVALKDDVHLIEFIDFVTHFKKFLLLIANESPVSESITLFSNGHKYINHHESVPIELITNSKSRNNIQLSISATNIEFKDIKCNFEEIIKTWYDNTDLHSSIDLIIEKFLNPNLSRENDFLNSCFAIETFHRRFRKIEIFKKYEFKKIRKSIVDFIENDEHKKFFDEKLSYANEPSFIARLFDLKKHFEDILPTDMDVDDYIVKIVKTRNYLVHRSIDNNIFDEFDMFYAARYIECIVRICILNEIKTPEFIIHRTIDFNKQHLEQIYYFNKGMRTSVPNINYI
jgi:hypothetical protein